MDAKLIIQEAFALLDERARYRIVPIKIRHGKLLRRLKVPNLPGWTFRGPQGNRKLVKITQAEHIRRRVAQRRAKIKRKAKRSRSIIKFHKSLRRLKSLRGIPTRLP